jgi:hypothetical protein
MAGSAGGQEQAMSALALPVLRARLAPTLCAAALLALTACGAGEDPTVAPPEPDSGAEAEAEGPVPDAGDVPTVVLDEAELEAEDQSGDGTSVVVAEVELPGDTSGHVVVHLDVDGELGPVLGSAAVQPGETEELTVPLETPTEPPATLVAVLHVDDGDGAFDPDTDPRVLDDDGEVQSERFDYEAE